GGVGQRAIHMHPAFQHMGEDEQVEQGGEHGGGNRLESHLPESLQFLAQQGREAGAHIVTALADRRAAHATSSRVSPCMKRTKASSRSCPPTWASRAWVVSRAMTRPCLSMAMRPQRASASSRWWL